jgi:type I restriction enzyme S subunit
MDWEEIYLTHEVDKVSKKMKNFEGITLPFIGLEHIEKETLTLSGTGDVSDIHSDKTVFHTNDILFGTLRPYFRKVWKAKFGGVCSTDITVLRAKEKSQVDQNFLFYFIANKPFIAYASSFAKDQRPRVNWKDVVKKPFRIPSKVLQSHIASTLSAYDDLIENNQKRIKLLEEYATLRYRLLKTNTSEGKDYKIKLGALTSFIRRGISPDYVDMDGMVVLNQKCIRDHIVSLDPSRLTSSEKVINADKMLQPYDTLINSTGAGTLGRMAINLQNECPMTVDSHITIVRANNKTTPLYLGMALLEQENTIESMGEGATNQTELSVKRLGEEITILVPSMQDMEDFDNQVRPMFELISNLQRQNVKLRDARDILLPRLMSGEIEV